MGLLDKVDNLDDEKPAKAVAKKAQPKKAVAKKAQPKKAVAKKAQPKKAAKPAKAAKAAKAAKPEGEKRIRPSGLPEGYELTGKMPRYIGWLINFAWNFGVAIGLLSILSTGADSDLTWGWAGAFLMIVLNWLVLPIWTGRNIGEFVSRSKYINSSGSKPFPAHAVLNNSLGFMGLIGMILMFVYFQDISGSGMVPFVIGIVMIVLWIVNFFLKKNSDYSQGIFDLAFSAYLVNHVATGTETGWLARFESLGDFGDKWQEKQASRQEKAVKKAEDRAKAAAEANDAKEAEAEDAEVSED
ncbi:MAG: hypothetical protein ACJZ6A_06330 [Candidatus Poseidoniaceae archaeon]|nr:hypothetical protein [Euryarchaeota archaeon]|tara:strand:- start:20 stop:916 length:897 start_codon:yes stop_codon:yes gene_type:complete